jgi:hypothetical protein
MGLKPFEDGRNGSTAKAPTEPFHDPMVPLFAWNDPPGGGAHESDQKSIHASPALECPLLRDLLTQRFDEGGSRSGKSSPHRVSVQTHR